MSCNWFLLKQKKKHISGTIIHGGINHIQCRFVCRYKKRMKYNYRKNIWRGIFHPFYCCFLVRKNLFCAVIMVQACDSYYRFMPWFKLEFTFQNAGRSLLSLVIFHLVHFRFQVSFSREVRGGEENGGNGRERVLTFLT